MTDFWTTSDDIPAVPGAYVLAINLTTLVAVHIWAKPSGRLAPGCYLYCGSAKGPGGLRARLAHHMRHGKSIHWHIDRLTEAGTVLGAWTFPGGDECDLVTALSHLPVAIEGFGSTDCRKCTSHLLRWPHGAGTLFREAPLTPTMLKTYGTARKGSNKIDARPVAGPSGLRRTA